MRAVAGLGSGYRRGWALAVVIGVVAAACGGGAPSGTGTSADSPAPASSGPSSSPRTGAVTTRPGACDEGGAIPAPEGPSAEVVTLREADDTGPRVTAAVYPRPAYEGKPWTMWGQGLALPDGRFLSAIGDHHGVDGNSYLFVFDPDTGRITRVGDILSVVDHDRGTWGYGKIHGQIVPGGCGEVYLATYWGTRRDLVYEGSYRGDYILRVDTRTFEMEPLTVPIPERGIPSLAGDPGSGLLYGEAVDPLADATWAGDFFAFDPASGEVVFRDDPARHMGYRNVMVDAEGRAYIAGGEDGTLLVYEPGADRLTRFPERLPGGWLRASTRPAPDGSVYGVTKDPEVLFALRPDGTIDELGTASQYVASVALDPSGDRFFFVPGAHGKSWKENTPLVAVDTTNGEQTVVVELNDLAERELGLTLGGTYSIQVDPSGQRLFIGFNAGETRDDPWGEVVLVVVELS